MIRLLLFVIQKALTVSGSGTTTMNYSHIEADFSSIVEGTLTVNAPNAIVKKFTWAVGTGGDETFDFVIIDFNTTDAETINTFRTAKRVINNKLYDADGGLIGTWDSSKIEVAGIYHIGARKVDGLFCNMNLNGDKRGIILSKFDSDLSSLRDGTNMFVGCDNLTSFSSNLSSLTDGSFMFMSCTNLTTFTSDLSSLMNGYSMFWGCTNLTSFTSDLSTLTEGNWMFYSCPNLESFNSDLSSLTNAEYMFWGCTNLTSFTSDLSSLMDGSDMFRDCINLTSFNVDLSNLIDGTSMFTSCNNLTSFNSDLSSLTDGSSMFSTCSFASFPSDLPSLTNGSWMFSYCKNLTSFSSDLSNLTNGSWMFRDCSKLTSFTSALPSLTDGSGMFYWDCKLDAPSIKNIIDTINIYSGELSLGMGCNDTTEDKDLFAQEVGYADMTSLLAVLQAKGWTVGVQYNGRPTSTYGLRRPSEDTLPVFVKLEEVEETENYADYTSADGSKKYILRWFHETTGSTEGYTQFNSLEEAIETLNIKPIERN